MGRDQADRPARSLLRGRHHRKEARTGIAKGSEVPHNPLELSGRHFNGRVVVCVRDAQVLAINVHELDFEVRDTILVCGTTPVSDT